MTIHGVGRLGWGGGWEATLMAPNTFIFSAGTGSIDSALQSGIDQTLILEHSK